MGLHAAPQRRCVFLRHEQQSRSDLISQAIDGSRRPLHLAQAGCAIVAYQHVRRDFSSSPGCVTAEVFAVRHVRARSSGDQGQERGAAGSYLLFIDLGDVLMNFRMCL